MPQVITISREYAAGGSDVARRVAAALGWSVVDNELIEQVAVQAGLPAEEVAEREERVPGFVERLARAMAASSPQLFPPAGGTIQDLPESSLVRITEKVVAEMAQRGKVVLVGRAAPAVLGDREGAFHVRLVADRLLRVQWAAVRLGIDPAEAQRIVDDTDRQRARYHKEYYGRDWTDATNYHLTINTGWVGMEKATQMVVGGMDR